MAEYLWPLLLPTDQQGLASMCAVSAAGVRVRFADGSEKLCGSSGLWNTPLGYGNEEIALATYQALKNASYLSVWGFENSYARKAADMLVKLAGTKFARVLFSTSGGAANDMAMKVARQYQTLSGRDHRKIILGLKDGYHGLTYGAFALTDARLGQRMYAVDRRFVGHIPANSASELERVLDRLGDQVAGIVVEPVIGTGAIPLTKEFVEALIRFRGVYDYVLIADEVTTGFGRTGRCMFASERWPERPDLIVCAKGLTNGTQAASALIVSERISHAFSAADALLGHAETQAGTPSACAAIIATLEQIEALGALEMSAKLSLSLDEKLAELSDLCPHFAGSDGIGCIRSIRVSNIDGSRLDDRQIALLVDKVRDHGALVHPGPSCIQILPAFVYTITELDELFERVRKGIAAFFDSKALEVRYHLTQPGGEKVS